MEFRAITPLGGICIWNPGAVPSQFCRETRLELGFPVVPKRSVAFRLSWVAEPGDSATWDDSNLWIAYGATHMVFRDGANPTGITAVSFIVAISTTETLFASGLAT